MNETIRQLKKIDTFTELSEGDLRALAAICEPAQFTAQSILGREGIEADLVFAITSGSVGIWVDYESNEADLLAVRKAPCLVGELGTVDDLPRSATIVTGTPVSGYVINSGQFHVLLEQRGSIALALMKSISRLVRSSNDSFVSELRGRNAELLEVNESLRTAQMQLVKQERLSNLGKFSSMILHDLRNPLSVIKGYADLLELKLEESDAELYKYAGQIRREVSRLAGLTGELLDYSRGEIRLAYAPIRIDSLMNQLRENVESRLNAKELNVDWDIGFNESALLDSERMLRVLINIIDNACKACSRGGRIRISSSSNANSLRFCVEDNGVGMDNETRSHAFEPFYSASDRGGTGLGMYIVKTVVEAHNGTVEIKSTLGEGTKVTLKLPMRI